MEERGKTNIAKIEHKHNETLETDTASGMWRSSPLKTFQIIFHPYSRHTEVFHSRNQYIGVVNALSAGDDFLTADKNIKRVCDFGVRRIGHGVKRASRKGKLVQDIIVSLVLLLDEISQCNFGGRAQVLVRRGSVSVKSPTRVSQQFDRIRKCYHRCLLQPDQILARKMLLDNIQFTSV